MYQINKNSYAIEEGDNISFVRDGGGHLFVFTGDCEAMKTSNPDDGPSTFAEDEMVVIEARGGTK